MGCYKTHNQTVDNTRIILQLAHERKEKLASYIRLTDGAIWGFLGFAAINLFKDNNSPPTNVPFFLIMVILSMIVWRRTVNNYQKDIVKGYYQIVNCEYNLHILSKLTLRENLCMDINPEPKSFLELCEMLKPEKDIDNNNDKWKNIKFFFGYSEKYTNKIHTFLNIFAVIIGGVALLLLIFL